MGNMRRVARRNVVRLYRLGKVWQDEIEMCVDHLLFSSYFLLIA